MIGKLLRLPPDERRPLVVAVLVLPLVRWGLVWFGFRRCWSWLRRTVPEVLTVPSADEPRQAVGQVVDQVAERAALAVHRAATHLPGTYVCLPRAMTLWWLLRRRGLDARLRLGVNLRANEPKVPQTTRLDAHAWIELNGQPLGEASDVEQIFTVMEPDLERKIE